MKSMNSSVASRHLPAVFALAITALFALDFSLASAQSEKFAAPNAGKWDYAALAKVPEKARAKRNPLENDPNAVAAGGKLYQEHCAECHGMKGEGGAKGANLRANEVQQATPGALFWVLTNGVVRRGMPVWSKLPDPERWQIVNFLKSLRAPAVPQTSAAPH
jgi:mono/diheme cytochrome c family protein